MATIGQKIKHIREHEAGLTQRQVADRLGKTSNYYARLERDAAVIVPRMRTAIAHALGVPVSRLDDDPAPGAIADAQRAVMESSDFARQSPRVQRWFRGLTLGELSIGAWYDVLRAGETFESKGLTLPGEEVTRTSASPPQKRPKVAKR